MAMSHLGQNTDARALGVASCCWLTLNYTEQLFMSRFGWYSIEVEEKIAFPFLDFLSVP